MPVIQQLGAQKPHQTVFARVAGCWGLQQLLTLPSLGCFSGIGTTTSHCSTSVITVVRSTGLRLSVGTPLMAS